MFRSSSPDDDISAIAPQNSPLDGSVEEKAERDESLQFDWSALIPLVHPMKTAIIEAMCWVQEPLSANLLSRMTGGLYNLQYVSYHVKSLAAAGLIVQVKRRQVRGATERLYQLDPRPVECVPAFPSSSAARSMDTLTHVRGTRPCLDVGPPGRSE